MASAPPAPPSYHGPMLQSHASLHARLAPLLSLPSQLDALRSQHVEAAAAATTQRAKLVRAKRRLDEAHAAASKGFLRKLRRPSKAARRDVHEAEAEHGELSGRLGTMEERIARLKVEEGGLLRLQEKRIRLIEEIDALDAMLFDGPTPAYPDEDVVEQQHLVLQLTADLLRSELPREARARTCLLGAQEACNKMVKELQAALQHGIDVGVANNTKYTRQVCSLSEPATNLSGANRSAYLHRYCEAPHPTSQPRAWSRACARPKS